MKRGVFLDRDGVLVPDVGYPHKISDAVPLNDVAPALVRLQRAEYELIVVSNQSGVGRGLFPLKDVELFNAALCANLREAGVNLGLKDFHICPHAPDQDCDCRKPKPGLLLKAARERSLDLSQSFLIGDKETDVEAARAAGVQPILLNREKGALPFGEVPFARNLIDATDLILEKVSGTGLVAGRRV
jgi:D-glycero-D-manno-heptose 1,7-bisphosphate phosphatase